MCDLRGRDLLEPGLGVLEPVLGSAWRNLAVLVSIVVMMTSSCSANPEGLTLAHLQDESILAADIPGLSSGRVTEQRPDPGPMLTQLRDVAGSWEAASVALADAVQEHGWSVASINCVGTGNDIIAKKRIEGQWVLLESGAGARGAGIILRLDPSQQPPGSVVMQGRCPAALQASVS